MSQYSMDVNDTEPRNRLTVAFRMILAIPHVIVVYFWAIVAEIVSIPQWFIVVFTGKRNEAIFDMQWAFLQYSARVAGYQYLMFDPYPPFGTERGAVPMDQALAYDETGNRLTTGLRFIWVIPALIITMLILIALSVVLFIVWFAVVITARFPRGMYDFTLSSLRYVMQLNAYMLLMTDTYPKWGSGEMPAGTPANVPLAPGSAPPPAPETIAPATEVGNSTPPPPPPPPPG
jgi:hypothetical protein